MIETVVFISVVFVWLVFVWLARLLISYKDIATKRLNHEPTTGGVNFHVLLPVLNENTRLNEFVEYFQSELVARYSDIDLWIVTTERERVEYPQSYTIQAASKFAKRYKNIHHVHYPKTTGVMAHQLNFALEHLPREGLAAVYNADSRPEAETFSWVNKNYKKDAREVFQQYGEYTKNYGYVSKRPGSAALVANMLWQCRWSLGFEYYRAYIGMKRRNWHPYLRPFNYCIGHGLIVDIRTLRSVKFSERTSNEDAIFGIEIAARGLGLCPVPYFDLSESPDRLSSIYKQKSVWFQGPYQALKYRRLVSGSNIGTRGVAIACLKLFSHAIYWIAGPVAVTTSLVIGVTLAACGDVVGVLSIISPMMFLAVPLLLSCRLLKKLDITNDPIKSAKLDWLTVLFGSLVAYTIHGAAAFRGVVFASRIQRGDKPKTTMIQYGDI